MFKKIPNNRADNLKDYMIKIGDRKIPDKPDYGIEPWNGYPGGYDAWMRDKGGQKIPIDGRVPGYIDRPIGEGDLIKPLPITKPFPINPYPIKPQPFPGYPEFPETPIRVQEPDPIVIPPDSKVRTSNLLDDTGLMDTIDAKVTNPMTAINDMIIGNTGGVPKRLNAPSGATWRELVWNSSDVVWQGRISNFIQLGDCPPSYVGQAGKFVAVNSGATALVFTTVASTSYPSAITNGSSTSTQNIDTEFTTTFTPKTITIYYRLSGENNGSTKYVEGDAIFNGTSCVLNRIFTATSWSTWAPAAFSTTLPNAGGTAAPGYAQIILSVLSVSATNFIIRQAYTCEAGDGSTGAASFVAVAVP